MRDWSVSDIIGENDRRNAEIFAKFNPITGEGSIGRRVRVEIGDYPIPGQWLPEPMLRVPLVKKLRKAGSVAALQEYIDKMRAELLEVYCMILVGDNPVLVGGENTYTIQAQATETPDTLTISRNGTVIASTTGSKTLVFGETPALTERGTITYSVEAKIGATAKRAEAKINVVLPIYLGAGAAARDMMTDANKLSARTEPKGAYTITVQTKGDYVWLILPDDMEFKGAELGGFQFPMSKKDVYVKDYNVYRSDLAYLTGDMGITLL